MDNKQMIDITQPVLMDIARGILNMFCFIGGAFIIGAVLWLFSMMMDIWFEDWD